MNNLLELRIKINDFRKYLENLILKKENLQDPEILAASKTLDSLLNEYSELLQSKIKDKNKI